jgi:Skp family chaperone for outer membrane proteins
VLLTLASIFLCGIVVTYVANAADFKEKYDNQQSRYQAADRRATNAEENFNKLKEETEQAQQDLNNEIASLKQQINTLNAALNTARSEADLARKLKDGLDAEVAAFRKTVEGNNKLMAEAQAELVKTKANLITEEDQHKETTTALLEKIAIIGVLEDKSKQLLEEKTDLQNKLNQILKQYGKITAPTEPVTVMKEPVRVAPPVTDIDLDGVITDVDLQERLAEISIGQANGVAKGMTFHATRDDRFICNIVIIDVLPDKATGWLDLLKEGAQNQPKVNDKISTNL